jgi:hypothetical protein
MEMTDLTPDKIEEMRKVWNESEKRFTPLINCPLCPPNAWYLLEKKVIDLIHNDCVHKCDNKEGKNGND